MKTDFEKIMEVIASVENTTYRRVVDTMPDSKITLDCSLWQRNIEFNFDSGKLRCVKVINRGHLCAQIEWSGTFAGAVFSDDHLHLYQNDDRYIKIHLEKGILFAK